MSFTLPVRVYYEDTDAGGIVYYANYLKFIERARTEALLALGFRQTELRDRLGVLFAVRAVSVDYLAPARLEDQLVVTATVTALGGSRIEMVQDVLRDGVALAKCRVTLVCIGTDARPARIPAEVRDALGGLLPADGCP
jgi:acyl-CoA thioester hydrolase